MSKYVQPVIEKQLVCFPLGLKLRLLLKKCSCYFDERYWAPYWLNTGTNVTTKRNIACLPYLGNGCMSIVQTKTMKPDF